MSHKEEVLKHIQKNGYITSWDAFTEYKNTRLSASIFCLREEGIDIKMKLITNPRTKSTYGVYYLKDKELKKYEQKVNSLSNT